MDWQQKVQAEIDLRGSSAMSIAERAGIKYTTLKSAMDTRDAWETVKSAIKLARVMETSVEYLFNPKTKWPQDLPIKALLGLPEELRHQVSAAITKAEEGAARKKR